MPISVAIIGTTTPAVVNATTPLVIPPTAIGSTVNQIALQWDISQHLSGNSVAMTMTADISFDGGNTWMNGFLGAGRDQGYDLALNKSGQAVTVASVSCRIPAGPTNMVRATLTASGPVTTFAQIVPAAIAVAV
jgi:hypothetical protein